MYIILKETIVVPLFIQAAEKHLFVMNCILFLSFPFDKQNIKKFASIDFYIVFFFKYFLEILVFDDLINK
jgi:hypothetical protein